MKLETLVDVRELLHHVPPEKPGSTPGSGLPIGSTLRLAAAASKMWPFAFA